jgi:hypothetical protein
MTLCGKNGVVCLKLLIYETQERSFTQPLGMLILVLVYRYTSALMNVHCKDVELMLCLSFQSFSVPDECYYSNAPYAPNLIPMLY